MEGLFFVFFVGVFWFFGVSVLRGLLRGFVFACFLFFFTFNVF